MEGPALLVCNHVSFVDWMIIASACKRPPRFVMYHGFLKTPLRRLGVPRRQGDPDFVRRARTRH